MSAIVHQRCWHHSSRQAVVRCPACHRFYCRECVTEHLGRMMCAGCVSLAKDAEAVPRMRSGNAMWIAFAAGGIFLAWLTFYYFGMMLARVPSDFFE
jgi:hypothetical protein